MAEPGETKKQQVQRKALVARTYVTKTPASKAPRCAPGEYLTTPAPPSIWERLDEMPRNPKTTLTHQQIAEAAVALADAEGLAAVSMRRLAESLGVATMALYRYVDTKDELLELMINEVAPPNPLPRETSGDWRATFREHGRLRRQSMLTHPWLVEAHALVPNPVTPALTAVVDELLGALAEQGLDGNAQMAILHAIDSYTRGAIESEVNQRLHLERRGYGADGDIRYLLRSTMLWLLNTGQFPHFTDAVRSGLEPPDPARDFEAGLECMMDGLAARFGI